MYTSKVTVVWEARDKAGLHHFERKPELRPDKRTFTGPRVNLADYPKCVVRRTYRVKVVGVDSCNTHGTVKVPLTDKP